MMLVFSLMPKLMLRRLVLGDMCVQALPHLQPGERGVEFRRLLPWKPRVHVQAVPKTRPSGRMRMSMFALAKESDAGNVWFLNDASTLLMAQAFIWHPGEIAPRSSTGWCQTDMVLHGRHYDALVNSACAFLFLAICSHVVSFHTTMPKSVARVCANQHCQIYRTCA